MDVLGETLGESRCKLATRLWPIAMAGVVPIGVESLLEAEPDSSRMVSILSPTVLRSVSEAVPESTDLTLRLKLKGNAWIWSGLRDETASMGDVI